MKVWCPARGQTETDAVEVSASSACEAAEIVAAQWHDAGDPFDRETFRVDAGYAVIDVEIVLIRRPTFAVVGTTVVRKEQD